jgi:hypothetical protein
VAKTVILLGLLANSIGGVGQSPVVNAHADLDVSVHAEASATIEAKRGAKARRKANVKTVVPSGTAAKKDAKAKTTKERKSMKNSINDGNKNVRSGAWSLLGDLAW